MVPIAGCAAKASSHPLTSTFDPIPCAHAQGRQAPSVQEAKKGAVVERNSRRRRPTSLSQMRRAARRASAREANGEAAAIAAAKRRLPLTRSTSSTERDVGVAIFAGGQLDRARRCAGMRWGLWSASWSREAGRSGTLRRDAARVYRFSRRSGCWKGERYRRVPFPEPQMQRSHGLHARSQPPDEKEETRPARAPRRAVDETDETAEEQPPEQLVGERGRRRRRTKPNRAQTKPNRAPT